MTARPLTGLSALVTAGPTCEPIDPVRFITNRSSGRQGYAIAQALADAGANVTLISGPVTIPAPENVAVIRVQTAEDMLAAVTARLPCDIAVCVAAVGDFRAAHPAPQKIKREQLGPAGALTLHLIPNPDILKTVSEPSPARPRLVIGFAAETQDVEDNAARKRLKKGCDWIVANKVSEREGFEQDDNTVTLITPDMADPWITQSKMDVARELTRRIAAHFKQEKATP
jgi:phosphopantothenoylcysteine decarboxylase/phosphopantothenate--cysteine ligase